MTSRPISRLLTATALAALALLAACQRKTETARTPASTAQALSQPATSGEKAPPLMYSQTSPEADVALRLPAELKDEPELHRRLYTSEVRDLQVFAENARAEFAEMGDAAKSAPPSEKRAEWSVADRTSKLLSLRSLTYETASGGAHSNIVYGAILWDRALKKPVLLPGLFKAGSDLAKVQAALCDGVRTEAHQRFGASSSPDGPAAACPKAEDTPFQLTPSREAGKAAGLTFLISPYSTGQVADAPYQVTVTLPTFRAMLAPAYADDFAGEPAPPRPSDQPKAG